MKQEERREQAIQDVAELLRRTPFKVEFKVKKKPEGVKVILEVTQEEMNAMTQNAANKGSKEL